MLLAGTAHATAQAQVGPPPTQGRDQDAFEPVGGRIGSFLLFPSAEARIEYDDNILALPTDPEGDVELTVRGAARLESQWLRHSLEASAYVQQNFHGRFTTEDVLEGGGQVRGRLDITRDTSARLVASYDALAESRASIASQRAALSPTRFRRADATLSLAHDFGVVQLTGDAQIQSLDFDDARTADGGVLEQDFRDSVYSRGAISAAIEVSPRVSALIRGQVDRLTFVSDTPDADPFDRDSTGFALEGGVRLELDNLIFGELRAGYLRREVDDPTGIGISGLSFAANVTWLVTPLTTVRLFADRQVEEGGQRLVSGNVRSQGRLVVEHELLRNLEIEGQASFARIDTVGLVEESGNEYNLMLEGTWKVDRNIRLFARADRFERFTSSDFFVDLARNRVLVGVRVEL